MKAGSFLWANVPNADSFVTGTVDVSSGWHIIGGWLDAGVGATIAASLFTDGPVPDAMGSINVTGTTATGELTIGVCEEICIPVTFTFDTLLPEVGARDASIVAAMDDTPMSADAANVGSVTCTIEPISDGLRMTSQINVAQVSGSEFVVIEPSDPQIWVSQAEVSRVGNTLSATVDMVHPSGQPFAFDRSGVRITVLGGNGRAIDLRGCTAD